MTAQYYLWYLTLMPIAAINNPMNTKNKVLSGILTVLWGFGQINWAKYADAFENYGEATLGGIQYANYAWFVINLSIMIFWLRNANLKPTRMMVDTQVKEKTE